MGRVSSKVVGCLVLLFLSALCFLPLNAGTPRPAGYPGPATGNAPPFTTFTDVTQKAGIARKITIGDTPADYLIDVKAGGGLFF